MEIELIKCNIKKNYFNLNTLKAENFINLNERCIYVNLEKTIDDYKMNFSPNPISEFDYLLKYIKIGEYNKMLFLKEYGDKLKNIKNNLILIESNKYELLNLLEENKFLRNELLRLENKVDECLLEIDEIIEEL